MKCIYAFINYAIHEAEFSNIRGTLANILLDNPRFTLAGGLNEVGCIDDIRGMIGLYLENELPDL